MNMNNTTPAEDGEVAETLTAIAREILGMTSLEAFDERGREFGDVAAWNIEALLTAAFNAGRRYQAEIDGFQQ